MSLERRLFRDLRLSPPHFRSNLTRRRRRTPSSPPYSRVLRWEGGHVRARGTPWDKVTDSKTAGETLVRSARHSLLRSTSPSGSDALEFPSCFCCRSFGKSHESQLINKKIPPFDSSEGAPAPNPNELVNQTVYLCRSTVYLLYENQFMHVDN